MPNLQTQYSQEQLEAISRQAKVELVKRYVKAGDILNWGRVLFPEKFPLPFCDELHGYLVSIRNEPLTNTEAPRNHAKTIIQCFLIPLYQALNEAGLYKHYLNVQATSGKAVAVNLAIRNEIENNDLLRGIYGSLVSTIKWTEKQFVLRNGTIFTSIGAGESLRGINFLNIRPDYIIVDDLYDEEDIHNINSTLKKNEWYEGSLYFARAKSNACCIHVQGTAINKSDLLHTLKSNPLYKSQTFRAVKDFATHEVLWEAMNTYEQLMEDKSNVSSTIWFRELQNERRDEESSIIKESWLKYYDGKIPEDETVVDKICAVDPSIGEKELNDYTGIAVIRKTKLKTDNAYRYYIDDLKNEHISLNERILLLSSLHTKEKFTRAVIEGIAGFKDFVAEVKRRTNLPVREVGNVKNKITNLENKSHWFENGKVFINKNIPMKLLNELVEQLTNNYPNHDDLRDAVLLAIDSDTEMRIRYI